MTKAGQRSNKDLRHCRVLYEDQEVCACAVRGGVEAQVKVGSPHVHTRQAGAAHRPGTPLKSSLTSSLRARLLSLDAVLTERRAALAPSYRLKDEAITVTDGRWSSLEAPFTLVPVPEQH
jgi:hypothetical protein